MIAYASADWEDSLLDMIKDNITKVAWIMEDSYHLRVPDSYEDP